MVSTSSPAPSSTYVEALRVPLRWWAIATMFHASTLLALLVAGLGIWAVVVMGTIIALTVAFLHSYGSARLEVTDRELLAGRARIGLEHLARPERLDAAATRHRMGPGADARAHLLVRPYVAESVVVELVDPHDPTPYWLLSTRHPVRLSQALGARLGGASEVSGDVSGDLGRAD